MSAALTPEPTSDFVCDCAESVRSACAGEPFYREHQGKRYCVLHFPSKEKSADFQEALERKLQNEDFNFRGVWFPDEVSFTSFYFTGEVVFAQATFSAMADFSYSTFSAKADFNSASFGSAYFRHVTFGADADFNSASFRARAYFRFCSFAAL